MNGLKISTCVTLWEYEQTIHLKKIALRYIGWLSRFEEVIYTIESETSDSGSAESVTRKQPHSLRSPQNLPISGSLVYEASHAEITRALGLSANAEYDLYIGDTTSGTPTKVVLKRESIQRHMFICGTTGSGKSYAMGVVAEELMTDGLPVIFLDTQDEYSQFVKLNNGTVVVPGQDFNSSNIVSDRIRVTGLITGSHETERTSVRHCGESLWSTSGQTSK